MLALLPPLFFSFGSYLTSAPNTVVPRSTSYEVPVVVDCVNFLPPAETSPFAVPRIQMCRRTTYYAGVTEWLVEGANCTLRAEDSAGGWGTSNNDVNSAVITFPWSSERVSMDRVVCSGYGPCIIAAKPFSCSPQAMTVHFRFERDLFQLAGDNGGNGFTATFAEARRPSTVFVPSIQ